MLRSDQFPNMIEMVKHVFNGRRFVDLYEHSYRGYSHYAAGFANFFDRFVRLIPGMPRGERPAVRMCDQNGLFRDLESVERSPIAAMRNVNGHADLVHFL